ncbi:MAG: PQQ-dependent sugar dehydrogenase [Desulfohalobiaceae bacterium]
MHTVVASLLILIVAAGGCWAQDGPVVGEIPQRVETSFVREPPELSVETWIQNLEVPWDLDFFPDGRALVTERAGSIHLIQKQELVAEPYAQIDVADRGEGGLMGLAIHPSYPQDPYVYAMYTYQENGEVWNRVQRFKDQGNRAKPGKIILDGIPGARFHNGGRIDFGPDGMLYITTGENFQARLAQDLNSLAGSILRVAPDGSIPADNPFPGSPIWSYGHRNPQGLAWHPKTGDLFASEHGPSGEFGVNGHDIVNVIHKGKNYGWPQEIGVGGLEEFEDPLIMWEQTTPPAGMTFWRGALFVATLKSEALMRIKMQHEKGSYHVLSIEGLFASDRSQGSYGRLRAAVNGPDGALYVLTSNQDGRGDPEPGDDRILKITAR